CSLLESRNEADGPLEVEARRRSMNRERSQHAALAVCNGHRNADNADRELLIVHRVAPPANLCQLGLKFSGLRDGVLRAGLQRDIAEQSCSNRVIEMGQHHLATGGAMRRHAAARLQMNAKSPVTLDALEIHKL